MPALGSGFRVWVYNSIITQEPATLKPKKNTNSECCRRNLLSRLLVTTVYVVLVTLIAAAVPFFGDFVALVGAIGFTPMDFVLPILLWNKVRKRGDPQPPRSGILCVVAK
jgi:amino acid permease